MRKNAKRAKRITLDGHQPRVNQPEVLIGEPVNVHYRHSDQYANNRVQRAIALAARITNLALTRVRKTYVVSTSVIPRMTALAKAPVRSGHSE